MNVTWNDLNPRQQAYLSAIFSEDQQAEAMERSRWSRGGRSRKADVWRWILYGILPELGHDSPLRAHLRAAKLVDPGTGATFQALESRGLIWCQYESDGQVRVRITPHGRKVVRAATGEMPSTLPPGTLREWYWASLAKAYAAGHAGIPSDGAGRYGGIGWNTWLRLRDYAEAALVEEHVSAFSSSGMSISTLEITAYGKWFYSAFYEKYRAMYPDVATRKPRTTHPKPASEVAPPQPKRLHVRATIIGDVIDYHTQRPVGDRDPRLLRTVALYQHCHHLGVATTAEIDPHHELIIAEANTSALAEWVVVAINAVLDAAPADPALPSRPAGNVAPQQDGANGGVSAFSFQALHWNRLGRRVKQGGTSHVFHVYAMAPVAPDPSIPNGERWCLVASMPVAADGEALAERLNALLKDAE